MNPKSTSTLLFWLVMIFVSIQIKASAQLITNDFENLPATPGFYGGTEVPAAAFLSNQLAEVSGVIFACEGTPPYVAVVTLGSGHATSGTNGIGGIFDGGLSYGVSIRLTFVVPTNTDLPAVTDFVSIKNDLLTAGSGLVTMLAYGLDGTLLATNSNIDDHAFTLSITNAGIHSILLTEENGSVAYDDLVLDLPQLPPEDVRPLTASIAPAVAISWPSNTNDVYAVEWTSRLDTNNWQTLVSSVTGNGTTNTVFDNGNASQRYYRVVTLR
jgi:hypothetical protein